MEGSRKTIEAGGKGEHRRAKRATDEMGSMGANIAALVVGMNGKVETHEFNEFLVLAKSELVCKVEAVVLVLLDWNDFAVLEDILVDSGSDGRQFGN